MSNPWAAIVGNRTDGRLNVASAVVQGLRARGCNVRGFLQDRFMADERLAGYDLVDVETGARRSLARKSSDPELCDWGFDALAFRDAREHLLGASSDVCVLELGPLEARGRGHWPTFVDLLTASGRVVLVCIRPQVLGRIAVELPDPVAGLELPTTGPVIDRFIDRVASVARHELDARDRL